MIGITARYFAAFREQAGCEQESLETSSRTAGDLFSEVSARHAFRDSTEQCKVAINGRMAAWDDELAGGDEILFFPPVAGG